jgi:hypothetical protein
MNKIRIRSIPLGRYGDKWEVEFPCAACSSERDVIRHVVRATKWEDALGWAQRNTREIYWGKS